MREVLEIEDVIQTRRAQAESVRGVDTPFRAEFRFRGAVKHWQYFATYEAAAQGTDASCTYGPTGRPCIQTPTSIQIQIRGPRGGWKPYQQ